MANNTSQANSVAINPDDWGPGDGGHPINAEDWGPAPASAPSPAASPSPKPSPLARLANPWLYGKDEPAQPTDKMEAIRRGLLQGGSFGFGDEAKGAIADPSLGDKYRQVRDADRAGNATSETTHPWLYKLAQLAGGTGSGLTAAALGPAALAGAGGAAALGGLAGLGGSTGDLTKGNIAGPALDTAAGTAGGYALGKLTPPVAKYISEKLASYAPASLKAALAAAKVHLRPTPTMAQVVGDEGMDQIGQRALDTGAIRPGAKSKETASNLDSLLDLVGKDKENLLAGSNQEINPHEVAQKFTDEVINPLLSNSETENAGRAMIRKRDAFLAKYAPGSEFGGRPMGSPAVVTRTPKYTWEDAPPQSGFQQIGEKVTPNIETEVVENTVPGMYGSRKEQTLRAYHTGDTVTPVNAYSTPERIPRLSVAERRLEEVPESSMAPTQLDAVKQAAQKKNNYQATNDAAIARQEATRGWANVLKNSVEKAVPEVKYPNELYGDLADALRMADRTKSLVHGGGGALGHLSDVALGLNAAQDLSEGRGMLGALKTAARILTKGKVASTAAVGMNNLSQLLANAPKAATSATPYLQAGAGANAPAWINMLKSQGGQNQ